MRRIVAVIGLTAACTLAVPAVEAVAARPNSETAELTLTSTGRTFTALQIAPGGHADATLTIANNADVTGTVKLLVRAENISATGWVSVGDTVIDIGAHASAPVALRLAVPSEATGGTYNFTVTAVLAGDAAAGTSNNPAGIAPTATATLPVSLAVTGPTRGALRVLRVHAVGRAGEQRVSIDVRNDGNVGVVASGRFVALAKALDVPLSLAVGAGQTRSISIPWHGGSESVSASLTLNYGNDSASWSGKIGLVGTPRPSGAASGASGEPLDGANTSAAQGLDTSGLSGVNVLVFVVLIAACIWLGYEMFASRRRRLHIATTIAPVPVALASDSLVELLAPLVVAIEHLAAAFTGAEVAPINIHAPINIQPESSTEHVPDDGPTEDDMPSDTDPYFREEAVCEYVETPLADDAVQSLSRIEAAASAVKDAYRNPDVDAAARGAIAAHMVADDAARRAELINAVASGLGIPKAVLLEWMPDDVFELTEVPAVPVDVVALQREHRVLELQVAILKRAVAHFANT